MSLTLEHFRTRQRSTPDWIIPGLLKRSNTLLIIGEPKKACKSWLLANLGYDLSEGKPIWKIHHSKKGFLFHQPKPMRVVYFSQEDTEDDMHDRLEMFFATNERDINTRFHFVPKNLQIAFDTVAGMQLITKELDEIVKDFGAIDLVMFDPMRRFHSKSENDSENIVAIWQKLDVIHQRYKCATILSHHPTKPSGNFLQGGPDFTSPHSGRGSGDIFGGGDAFINVVPKNNKGQSKMVRHVELHFESKRGKPLFPVNLQVSFHTGQVSFESFKMGRDEEDEVIVTKSVTPGPQIVQ